MENTQNNVFFKYLSFFLLGLILGYSLKGMDFSSFNIADISGQTSNKVIGQANAPITMTEYSDFQCPLCKKFFDETYPTILENYIKTGKVKYIMKHFPLSIHPQAPAAALASECALEQGKFGEMHDQLFQTQENWSGNPAHLDLFKQIATQLKLDQNKFANCLDNKTYQANIDTDYQEGLQLNVDGTPTFYINNQLIVGAQDSKVFLDALEKELAEKTKL
jgi:protein-disulfide isomerase